MRQCLFNLLSNAAKFTKGGAIGLEAWRERMEGVDSEAPEDWMVFRVTDTGIGMSAEQILRLFQAFTQADASTTRKYGGTGLGLTITRRFCQMMGGDVTVQSVPGEGSAFTMKVRATIHETVPEALAEDGPRGRRRGRGAQVAARAWHLRPGDRRRRRPARPDAPLPRARGLPRRDRGRRRGGPAAREAAAARWRSRST